MGRSICLSFVEATARPSKPIIANQKIVGSIRSAVGIVAKPGDIADSQFVQGVPGILRGNTDKMKGDFGAIFFLTIAN